MEKSPVSFGHILLAVDQNCNVSLHLIVCCALLLQLCEQLIRDANTPMNCEQPMNDKSAPGAVWQVVGVEVEPASCLCTLNNMVQQSCFCGYSHRKGLN